MTDESIIKAVAKEIVKLWDSAPDQSHDACETAKVAIEAYERHRLKTFMFSDEMMSVKVFGMTLPQIAECRKFYVEHHGCQPKQES